MLLIPPASILAAYIRDQGLMSDPADSTTWPLYVSYLPDETENDAGSINNIQGVKDGRIMEGSVIQHYGLELIIRSTVHNTGWAKMEAIATNLDSVHRISITVSGENYEIQNIKRDGIIETLGSESGTKKRQLFRSIFLMTVKKV